MYERMYVCMYVFMYAHERPHTHAVDGSATLEPEPTQHINPTFVWTYIARHVWLHLIRHVCPDF